MWEQILETKSCKKCSENFNITQADKNFYEKVSPSLAWKKYLIPSPTLCPGCRRQRRLVWKNELQLYKNTCAGCGTWIISRFHTKSNITNYCNKCWSSDSWDAKKYGKEFDFSQSFFEQVQGLIQETPFQNLIGSLSNIEHNAVYTNCTADIHNSYMVSESDFVSDCYYGRLLRKSNDLFDCLSCSNSEYSYECTYSDWLYKCFYTSHSTSCRDIVYWYDCHGCTNCIWCVWLENQKYCVLNTQVSKEEYQKILENIFENTKIISEFQKLAWEYTKWKKHILNSENCSGSNITNSSNCKDSHWILECQDCQYSDEVNYSQDLFDISSYGSNSYLMYDSMWVGRYSNNILFCSTVGRGENLIYCIDTKKSKNCFGCVNMKDAEYCILNTQYTKLEYKELVPKIITHMQTTWEWGEFFPASISPFGYNETVAQEYFPLEKWEAESQNFNWLNYEVPLPKVDKIISAEKLPKNIADIPDDVLNWAIECEVTKKPFRIISQELEFYKKHNLWIPKRHPDQRRIDRILH